MLANRLVSRVLQQNDTRILVSQALRLVTTQLGSSNLRLHKSIGLRLNGTKILVPKYKLDYLIGKYYSVSAASLKDSEEYRNEHGITITGGNVPDPITDISNTEFPEYITRYLKSKQFEKPTTIQAQGWPIAMGGKNLVGIAQTGTGKTLAYLLPAIIHIKEKSSRKGLGPVVLVVAPTRELARQIQDVAREFERLLNIRSVCIYGGANRARQADDLERGVDIVIATPGRLNDFLISKTTNLSRCTYVVLDEADRMLDMGFEPQIRKIMETVPLERQILMWSATWPKEVQSLAEDFLGEYVQVNVGSTELSANHNIEQKIHICEQHEKMDKLNFILQDIAAEGTGKILIFTNTKRFVEDLTRNLRKNGWPAVGIHGDKTQNQRDSIIHQFKHGRAKILVASDVAARGLDVDGVSHVINYDYPNTSEDYIHRIGRTGRSGSKGTSHTLLTEENDRQAKDLIAVLREANQEVPSELLDLSRQYRSSKYKETGSYSKYKSNNNWSSRKPNNNWGSSDRWRTRPRY